MGNAENESLAILVVEDEHLIGYSRLMSEDEAGTVWAAGSTALT